MASGCQRGMEAVQEGTGGCGRIHHQAKDRNRANTKQYRHLLRSRRKPLRHQVLQIHDGLRGPEKEFAALGISHSDRGHASKESGADSRGQRQVPSVIKTAPTATGGSGGSRQSTVGYRIGTGGYREWLAQ